MKKLIGEIIIFILLPILLYICIKNVESMSEYKINYDENNDTIINIYKDNPNLFNFENNKAIIDIETLYTYDSPYLFTLEHDSFGNECIGYYIIEKKNNDLLIDSSHTCDMIDY